MVRCDNEKGKNGSILAVSILKSRKGRSGTATVVRNVNNSGQYQRQVIMQLSLCVIYV